MENRLHFSLVWSSIISRNGIYITIYLINVRLKIHHIGPISHIQYVMPPGSYARFPAVLMKGKLRPSMRRSGGGKPK